MASSSSSSSPDVSHVVHPPPPDRFSFKYASQDDVLEDLSSRFILNLPEEELASVERICFQVEQAHWYYEDFIREENPKFPSLPLKKFSAMLFHSCPLLKQWSHDHEQAFNTFMQYKTRVPVCGAIMLNNTWDKCVLVKGWKSSSGWGFPKGKINQDEEPHRCAIREVLEETGYDLSKQINPDDCIEMSIKEQRISLYVVPGVPEDYPFQTRTRKEISKIEWFSLADLPTWKRNKQVSGKFYLISPFVPPLKEFIRVNRPTKRRQQQRKAVNGLNNATSTMTPLKGNGSICDPKPSYKSPRDYRNADGSSSQSSVDHAAPQTPSPKLQLQEACAIVDDLGKDIDTAQPEGMDPHFARLMEGLSLSAAKLSAISSEGLPVACNRPATLIVEGETVRANEAAPLPEVDAEYDAPLDSTSDIVNTRKDLVGLPSGGTVVPTPSGVTITQQTPTNPARRLKHLALLESVASESARMVSPHVRPTFGTQDPNEQGTRAAVHPGPSSSVPPILRNIPSPPPLPPHHSAANVITSHGLTHTVNTPAPPFIPPVHLQIIDPLTSQIRTRPMTSNGIHDSVVTPFLYNPAIRPTRHGANLSMHQGNLLHILGSDKSQINVPLSPMNGRFVNRVPDTVPHAPLPYPNNVLSQLPGSLRVVPPLSTAFGLPPGPLTGPIAAPGLMMPLAPEKSMYSAHSSSDRTRLLSLLKPSSKPQSKAPIMPILNADTDRRN